MREVIGDRTADELITIGRQDIEIEALARMQEGLYDRKIEFIVPQIRTRLSNHPSFLEAEVFRLASNSLSNDQVIKEADLQDPRAGLKKGVWGESGLAFESIV